MFGTAQHFLCKRLLENGHEVLGVDVLNDYYDVELKKSRLSMLTSDDRFEFRKEDIAERRSDQSTGYGD